ncbi:hypothetical protein C8F04DRAFT_1240393 [Mycena alexandri]|uniref:Transposase n=1 Tax=Mycena alexandri TaxID=1745969 RepID=A0AAD6WTK5_9AGAR|nr:hypothetical protein C8F04DRAFT_1240393 [Mycena alexandri]
MAPNALQCRFCGARVRTARGLSSHTAQSPACRQKLNEVMPESWRKNHARKATPSPEPQPEVPADLPQDENAMDVDPPLDNPVEPPPPAPAVPRGVTIEEVEDEDAPGAPRYFEDFPKPAGYTVEENPVETVFEAIRRMQEENGEAPWAPFDNEDDWNLARWLSKAGVSGGNINEFLKLNKIKDGAKPSYHNTRAFFQKTDALPSGPEWECEIFDVRGDEKDASGAFKTEEVEFWKRNPVDCIRELMGNAAFRDQMHYAPLRKYRDEAGTRREYDEMWTGEWWWKLQELLPPGVTICPVILASDKTQLSRFSGDKQAWPVYLSVGNLSKETRRKPSQRATVLLGYIPVCKLHCFSKANWSVAGHQLFHRCMRTILEPLIAAGTDGVDMLCADGYTRRVYPILAAYIADYPEQCLVACCKENRCPKCVVDPKKRGEPVHSALRDPDETIKLMKKHAKGLAPKEFEAQGLRPADPFWKDLPHCDIFECFTPDILHQLHKGVFKDHVVNWTTQSLGGTEKGNEDKIDFRFRLMPGHPSLRHFKLGISLVSQWTGNEYKSMEKIFLGVINGCADPQVVRAVRGILDFIEYAHFETHTDASLKKLEEAWLLFHANKIIFKNKKIRNDFDIPKIHSMQHYVDMIRALGTADGYNTELSEHLHIDCAKLGYAASSRKEYIRQMTTWLTRHEAIDRFVSYLQWAIPGYLLELNDTPQVDPDSDSEDSDDDELTTNLRTTSIHLEMLHQPTPLPKKRPFPAFLLHCWSRITALQTSSPTSRHFFGLKTFFPGDSTIYLRPFLVINDPIRATRATPSRGLKRAVPAHFDTVLARKEAPVGPQPRLSLEGLFAGRVRVIFALPVKYGRFNVPLAYVEWYKPLTQLDADLDFVLFRGVQ